MPSHNIHLAIAKKVNLYLNMDLDAFMLGNVLPDIICKDHIKTHFCPNKPGISGITRPDIFYKKYKDKLNNPTMLGYLIHLLIDKYYNEYMFKNYFLYNENGEDIGLIIQGKNTYLDSKKIKKLKHQELNTYGAWLLEHNFVPKFKSVLCINKVMQIEDFNHEKEVFIKYIIEHNNMIDKKRKFKIFNFLKKYKFNLSTKNNWDKIYIDCCDYIIKYLKNKKIIKN